MRKVYIYCEGQTEESFINEVLSPYFGEFGIRTIPVVAVTKRTKSRQYCGGVSNYEKVRTELRLLCSLHPQDSVTTMFDYYAMPRNTPDIENAEPNIFRRVRQIEAAVTQDIGCQNCFFYLMLHEFEALLYSEPRAFRIIADDTVVKAIRNIRRGVPTPEHINNSPETAPSKRLLKLIPRYAKVKNGTILSKRIGMPRLMHECEHFCDWIEAIKRFQPQR